MLLLNVSAPPHDMREGFSRVAIMNKNWKESGAEVRARYVGYVNKKHLVLVHRPYAGEYMIKDVANQVFDYYASNIQVKEPWIADMIKEYSLRSDQMVHV